jgi:hypothetical protein
MKLWQNRSSRNILLCVIFLILVILAIWDGPPTLTNRSLADKGFDVPYYYYYYTYFPLLIRSFFR